MKRTKILCTIGPSCETPQVLKSLARAGMNVARLNFSHGTHENHAMLIKNIRSVEKELGTPIAVLQDLQGPKIRVGKLPEEGVLLEVGKKIVFSTGIDEYTGDKIPVGYKELHLHVKEGERLLLNDGKFEVSVDDVDGTDIDTTVVLGGTLTSNKGINVPDSNMDISVITDKDKEDLRFGIKNGVDIVALSFVMRKENIIELRSLIDDYQKELGIHPDQPIAVVAKIERREAVENIKEILEEVDAVMVARGDLGIEVPAQEVPVIQKQVIEAARKAAKSVIVATQMLDSMQENPRPTRAEVSDVANAVMDHTDAVMLSNETSTGKYPLEAVQTMSDIILEAERSIYDDSKVKEVEGDKEPIDVVISELSRLLADKIHAHGIVAASLGGHTAKIISRYRPELPLFIGTSHERTWRQMALAWGVIPFMSSLDGDTEDFVDDAIAFMKKHGNLKTGDAFVVVAGDPLGEAEHVNTLEVREVS